MTNERTIEILTKALSLTVASDGNNGYMVNNTFAVRPETKTESRQSIGRTIETEVTEWVIEVADLVRGGRWEPDTYDIVELARYRDLGDALIRCKTLEIENDANNILQAEAEAEAEREWDEELARMEAGE